MRNFTLLLLIALLGMGCSKQLEFVPQDNQLLAEEALVEKADYEALLNSCYDVLANTFNGKSQKLSFVMTDNAAQPNQNDDLTEAYNYNTLIFNGTTDDYFKQPNIAIRRCNSLLSELTKATANELGFTDAEWNQFTGEARFIRALCLFDMTRKFGHPWGYTGDNSHLGVVLRTEPTADILPRATIAETYAFLIDELSAATALLDDGDARRANRFAAHALLAKVYFYQNEFSKAIPHLNTVIDEGGYVLDTADRYSEDLSSEAIFAIISTDADRRSGELQGLFNTGGQPTLSLSRSTYDLLTATESDTRQRYLVVINPGQENEILGYNRFNASYFNIPVLHLTEMLLMRAECLAETGENNAQAIADLNQVKARAYGGDVDQLLTSGAGPAQVISACRLERRLETIGEAERLFDVKRIGAKGEQATIRGATWDCNGMLLQFPADEQTQLFVPNPSGGDC